MRYESSYGAVYAQNELWHHGIKGQEWGVRRFQNEDGTLTAAGKERYYGGSWNSDPKHKLTDDEKKQFTEHAMRQLENITKQQDELFESVKNKKATSEDLQKYDEMLESGAKELNAWKKSAEFVLNTKDVSNADIDKIYNREIQNKINAEDRFNSMINQVDTGKIRDERSIKQKQVDRKKVDEAIRNDPDTSEIVKIENKILKDYDAEPWTSKKKGKLLMQLLDASDKKMSNASWAAYKWAMKNYPKDQAAAILADWFQAGAELPV